MVSYAAKFHYKTCTGEFLVERFKAYRQDNRLQEMKSRFLHDALWIASLAIGLFLLLALLSHNPKDPGWAYSASNARVTNLAGSAGAWLSSALFSLIGFFAYCLPLIAFYRAWVAFRERKSQDPWNPLIFLLRTVGWALFLVVGCALATVHIASNQSASAGGYLGIAFSEWFFPFFGITGSTLILVLLWFLSLTLAAHISWLAVVDRIGQALFGCVHTLRSRWQRARQRAQEKAEVERVVEQRKQNLEVQLEKQAKRKPPQIKPLKKRDPAPSDRVAKEQQKSLFDGGRCANWQFA